jgi:hypothetical protein
VRAVNKLTIRVLRPGEEPILAGRLSGKRNFLRVLEEILPFAAPTLLFLDFQGVELATSSFLSEALLPLRDHLRSSRPPAYVVVANLAENVAEELDELLIRSSDAVLACDLATNGDITQVRLIGRLEEKLLETFNLIRQKGAASAVELHAESQKSGGIGPTAWNNRLSVLTSKSLVMEIAQGRTKKYRPVLEMA